MSGIMLEVVVDSVDSAIEAEKAGAMRLELCSALDLGGITPGMGLVEEVVKSVNIPVFVLVRPRGGNFCYSENENRTILKEIELLCATGTAGVVTGSLTDDGTVDIDLLKKVRKVWKERPLTFHRAFDRTVDPMEQIKILTNEGVDRVLTSGGAKSALEGLQMLKKLNELAGEKLTILPGGGINENNVTKIIDFLNITEVHFSGIIPKEGPAAAHYIPFPEKVRKIREIVDEIEVRKRS